MQQEKSQPPIVVTDLHKSFGEQTVLDGLNLRLAPGETVAVLGRSGTGKSVLLKTIIGLQQPDSGAVHVAGQEIGKLDPAKLNEVRKKIGFLFQQAALYDSMTVSENVAFPLSRHSDLSPEDRTKRVQELLALVGMDRDIEKLPSEISGGMQKRVGLARALALDPDILLLDEPTAGLDPITAAEIGALIVDLRKRRSTAGVVVTHDIRTAQVFSDRFMLIDEGSVRAEGSFHDLEKSRDQFVVRFLSDSRVQPRPARRKPVSAARKRNKETEAQP